MIVLTHLKTQSTSNYRYSGFVHYQRNGSKWLQTVMCVLPASTTIKAWLEKLKPARNIILSTSHLSLVVYVITLYPRKKQVWRNVVSSYIFCFEGLYLNNLNAITFSYSLPKLWSYLIRWFCSLIWPSLLQAQFIYSL